MPTIKAAQAFWTWFMNNENAYLNFKNIKDDEQNSLLEELYAELKKYSKDLGFTLSFTHGPLPALIITAKGNADLFEDVMFLIHHAPESENWNFISFIPQTEVPEGFTYQDVMLSPDDIYFTARRNWRRLGLLDLTLYVIASKDAVESDALINTAILLLLHLLGEANFAACIGTFSIQEMPADPSKKRLRRLRELPEFASTRNVIKKLIPAMESRGIVV